MSHTNLGCRLGILMLQVSHFRSYYIHLDFKWSLNMCK